MPRRKTKKRKKIKYRKVVFKLSAQQKKSLDNYCAARKTTPNKLIKKSISRFIYGYSNEVPDKYYLTPNQLGLFDEEEDNKKLI